jgi:hypothetical protein
MPFSRVVDSLERHVQAFKAGDNTEDHLAAVMCNAMFLLHYQELIGAGVLPSELDDMPRYQAAGLSLNDLAERMGMSPLPLGNGTACEEGG